MLGLGQQQNIVIGLHGIHPVPSGNQMVLGNLLQFIRQQTVVAQVNVCSSQKSIAGNSFLDFSFLTNRLEKDVCVEQCSL